MTERRADSKKSNDEKMSNHDSSAGKRSGMNEELAAWCPDIIDRFGGSRTNDKRCCWQSLRDSFVSLVVAFGSRTAERRGQPRRAGRFDEAFHERICVSKKSRGPKTSAAVGWLPGYNLIPLPACVNCSHIRCGESAGQQKIFVTPSCAGVPSGLAPAPECSTSASRSVAQGTAASPPRTGPAPIPESLPDGCVRHQSEDRGR